AGLGGSGIGRSGGGVGGFDIADGAADGGKTPFGIDHFADAAVLKYGIGLEFGDVGFEEFGIGFLIGGGIEGDGAEQAVLAGVPGGTGFSFVRDRTVGFCTIFAGSGGVGGGNRHHSFLLFVITLFSIFATHFHIV